MISKIRIAGIEYEIIEFDGDFDRECMGREVYDKAKIYIRKDMPDGKKFETLLHELFHIVYANSYLKPGDEEERVVGALSTGLYQILADNYLEKD